MAALDQLRRLPPWALYGGAGLGVGGGYLLYRKRKMAAATAAAAPTDVGAPQRALSMAGALPSGFGQEYQQSSVVPYYLTDNQRQLTDAEIQARREERRRRLAAIPPVQPATVPGGENVIPPILPATPTQPLPPIPPPPPPPPPPPAAPQPPSVTNLSPDLLARIQAGGEQIVQALVDPQSGGTWWLGSKGGVFAVGGAPFFGSARPYGFDDPNVRRAVGILPLGRGYRIQSSRGENYDFPG